MTIKNDRKIIESWKQNASPWIRAIEEQQIDSRRLITDKAIIDTILSLSLENILDIGCGEGWLVRELSAHGLSVTGIDAIKQLIDRAKEQQNGTYKVIEYENISPHSITEKYSAVICNFSLIGKESVEHIFNMAPLILTERGYLIIQTLNPTTSCGDQAYADGWRDGSWEGFSNDFRNPAPWYFRTQETWRNLYQENGFELKQIKEPVNPNTKNATSLIMVGKKRQ
ncbi:MAG: class I SAM-dependent methyltransferase [Oceanicoccus sp.]